MNASGTGRISTLVSTLAAVLRRNRWAATLVVLLVLFAVFFLLLPFGIRWGLEKWIERNSRLQAQIENVDFNLFTGNLVIDSLVAERPEREAALQWVRASFEIAWRPILRKRIRLDDIRVQDAAISVVETADGALYAGGLRVRRARDAPRKKTDGGGWEIGFGSIDLDSIRVRWRTPSVTREALIHTAHLDPMQSWNPDAAGRFTVRIGLEGGILDLRGKARLYADNREVSGRLKAEAVPVAWLNPLFQQVEQAAGTADAEGDFAVAWGKGVRAAWEGRLAVEGLSGAVRQANLRPAALTWDGAVVYTGDGDGRPPEISAAGRLGAENVNISLTGAGLRVETARLELKGRFARPAADAYTWDGAGRMQGARLTRLDGDRLTLAAGEIAFGPLQAAGNDARVRIVGSVEVEAFTGAMPDVRFEPMAVRWRGTAQVNPSRQYALALEGAFEADRIGLALPAGNRSVAARAFSMQGELHRNAAEGLTLSGSDGRVERLLIAQADNARPLASARRAAFAEARVTSRTIRLAGVRIEDLETAGRDEAAAGRTASLFAAQGLEIDSLDVSPEARQVRVNQLDVSGLDAVLMRNEKGRLAGLPGSAERAGPDEGWTFFIDQAVLGDRSRLRFVDTSVAPQVDLTLNDLQARAGAIGNAEPRQSMSIAVESKIGTYAGLSFSGRLSPFAAAVGMDIEGEIRSFSLTEIRAYLARQLGYSPRSGQLDADFQLKATRGELDAIVKLRLDDLNLVRLAPEAQDEFVRELGMPLNAALDLLRDRSGTVRMTLPVTGALDRPDVDYAQVIGQAVKNAAYKAIKTAALSYFAPLGAVYAASKIFGRIIALRLEPVVFSPGQIELNARQRDYLDRVSAKIADRPEVRLLLCGRAVSADRRYFRRIAPEGAARGTEEPAEDGRDDTLLLDIAETRAEAVRSYLVSKGIDAERLVFCAPEVAAADDARPQVELAL